MTTRHKFPERVQRRRRGQLGIFGDNRGALLDTPAVARALANAAEFTPAQADAITDAVRQAAEHGDQVTELRTEMAGQRTELTGQIAELAVQIAEQRAEVAEVRTEIANLDTWLSTQIAEVRTEVGALDTRFSIQICRRAHRDCEPSSTRGRNDDFIEATASRQAIREAPAAAISRGSAGRSVSLATILDAFAKAGVAVVALKENTSVSALCRELGIRPVTLYRYVGPQGELREQGQKVLAT